MEVKSKGIELEVRTPQDEFVGGLIMTKTQLIWCEGKTTSKNGKTLTWEQFHALMKDA